MKCYVCGDEMEKSSDGKQWICPTCGYRCEIQKDG